jgi:hypothetical protein
MDYISQTIVFILAILGILFKSTKTDAEGKTVHSASGLPVLTTTGKVVIVLLLVSFGISVLSVRNTRKSEDEATRKRDEMARQLEQANQYNKGIDAGVREVLGRAEAAAKEQREKFGDVLTQQERTGKNIAGGISASATQLQSGIERSATLLRGRLDNSISLLNHTAGDIASLADPITAININPLWLEIPLTHPALAGYRARLEAGIRQALASNSNEVGRATLGNRQLFTISNRSGLLPDPQTEPVAHAVLSSVDMTISFYKKPRSVEQLKNPESWREDLYIPVLMEFPREETSTGRSLITYLSLSYDMQEHRAYLYLLDLILAPPDIHREANLPVSNSLMSKFWWKPAGGKVTGIPDLPGSQIVARIREMTYRRDGAEAANEIRREMRIAELGVNFAEELSLHYLSERLLATRPQANGYPLINMKQFSDKDGYPFYVYDLPSTLNALTTP